MSKASFTEISDSFLVMKYIVTIACNANYYGKRCTQYCLPSHTQDCSHDGIPVCKDGWTGIHCIEPECGSKCNHHGVCIGPNVCKCYAGWNGPLCNNCITSEHCVWGHCALNGNDAVPFTCECYANYGGLKCDLDLVYCDHLKNVCFNKGICQNLEKLPQHNLTQQFKCICSSLFSGARCELLNYDACRKSYCNNRGNCRISSISSITNEFKLQCTCDINWHGKFCQIQKRWLNLTCDTVLCSNETQCVIKNGVSLCLCLPNGNANTTCKNSMSQNITLSHNDSMPRIFINSNSSFLLCIVISFALVVLFIIILPAAVILYLRKRRITSSPSHCNTLLFTSGTVIHNEITNVATRSFSKHCSLSDSASLLNVKCHQNDKLNNKVSIDLCDNNSKEMLLENTSSLNNVNIYDPCKLIDKIGRSAKFKYDA